MQFIKQKTNLSVTLFFDFRTVFYLALIFFLFYFSPTTYFFDCFCLFLFLLLSMLNLLLLQAFSRVHSRHVGLLFLFFRNILCLVAFTDLFHRLHELLAEMFQFLSTATNECGEVNGSDLMRECPTPSSDERGITLNTLHRTPRHCRSSSHHFSALHIIIIIIIFAGSTAPILSGGSRTSSSSSASAITFLVILVPTTPTVFHFYFLPSS